MIFSQVYFRSLQFACAMVKLKVDGKKKEIFNTLITLYYILLCERYIKIRKQRTKSSLVVNNSRICFNLKFIALKIYLRCASSIIMESLKCYTKYILK